MTHYGRPARDDTPNAVRNLRWQEGWAPHNVGTGDPIYDVEARGGQLLLKRRGSSDVHWSVLLCRPKTLVPLWLDSAHYATRTGSEGGAAVACEVGDRPASTIARKVHVPLALLIQAAYSGSELLEVPDADI